VLWCGCRSHFRPEILYSDAHHKLLQGLFEEALQEADRGYHTAEGKDLSWAWKFRILKAEAYLRQGKSKEALDLLSEDPPAASPLDISARNGILKAEALCRLNQLGAAEAVFQQVEQLIPSSETDLRSQTELARGRCAMLFDRAVAKSHFINATSLAHGNDGFVEGIAFLNLGFLLLQEEHYDQAIANLNQVPAATDSFYARERAFGNLGFIYSQLGDWRNAISFSQQAEAIAVELKNQQDQELWSIDLGKAHHALHELPEAEAYYLKALSIAQSLGDKVGAAGCFNNLTRLALAKQNLEQAEEYLKQGTALQVERERLHFAFDAARIAGAHKQFLKAEQILRDLLQPTEQDSILHSMVQRELGRVMWEEKKIPQADQMFRNGINTAEQAVPHFKRPEYRMSFMDQDPFYDSYIQFLVAQKKPAEALKIAERSRAQVMAAALDNSKATNPVISAPDLQELSRRRNQTILSYAMTDEKTFLWVITPSRFTVFELPGHSYVGLQILAFQRELQEHLNPEKSPAGAKLYETLVRPAEELIPRGSNVVIIPSKILSLVNFEALIVPGLNPHYWIDDVDVQVAGSLAMLAKAKSAPIRSPHGMKDLLLLGAPIQASKDFPVLQNAPEEIRRVGGHFPAEQETVISGKDATPQRYRASDPGRYRFLHFDAHGVASDLSPLESAIILSPGSDGTHKLLAREIKDIPLHADLVTISACSGSGTRWYQGEGLVGLAWAFMHAGAHQVVGALWDMDEASSPQLMDDFYNELTHGKSAAEALRNAKLKMLHSNTFYRHPYYWASLQLYTGS
jgi:CHAT domain-containing protein/tetratricopeptide (TPR) repeat protein